VLAIIAYHQPVTRAEIEDIRGVQTSRGTLDVLMEAGGSVSVAAGAHRAGR
jgi:chromosome segregation and condensation protein ScpB